jgi:riboflavin biosynthesis pyrimidine reductase
MAEDGQRGRHAAASGNAAGSRSAADVSDLDAAALEVLVEAPGQVGEARGGTPPAGLARRYGGPLAVSLRPDRPTVIANFVESLDGIVALGTGPRGGGSEISGASEPDRFVMALLRTLADVVVVGAGTFRAAPGHEWTPRGIAPRWAADCAAWRAQLGLPSQPAIVVVSASGDLPPHHPGLSREDVRAFVVTTGSGARRLADRGLSGRVRVEVVSDAPGIEPGALLGFLSRLGTHLALCEGGPHLLSGLLTDSAVDELFVTVAPQLLGRGPGAAARLGLAEGHAWDPREAPWGSLRSVRRAGSHLFLRYGFAGRRGPAPA